MKYAFLLIGLAVLLLGSAGCRTGEYKFDHDIYAAMPGLIMADPDLAKKVALNPDGTPVVTFEKGVMSITVANGLDEGTRKKVVSDALKIFHDQYMNNPEVKTKNGTFKRETIGVKGFVETTELYVIEWKLKDKNPNLLSDRSGNFM